LTFISSSIFLKLKPMISVAADKGDHSTNDKD
jgi:hypothetical protein